MLHSICVSVALALAAVTEADPPGPPKAVPSNPAPTRPGTTKPTPVRPGQGNPVPVKPGPTQPMTTKSPVAELGIGDPAPKIDVQDFVKGSPVKQFEKGKIYVIEFMAFSSDASRESLPILSKLQADNKDVVFLAISLDGDAKAVKSVVERLADKLTVRMAVDARDGENGHMEQSWLEASSQEGIPVCFIVNGEGRIAWIGHPGDLEAPLTDIVAGKFDLAAEAAEYKKALAQRKAIARLQDELGLYMKKKDYPGAIKLLDGASKELDLPDEPRMIHLALLAGPGSDPDRALTLGQKLVEKAAKMDDGAMMMMISRALVDPYNAFPGGGKGIPSAKVDPKLAALAVHAAEQGEDNEDADSLMIVALAYRAAGQNDKAIAKLDDAADLLNGTIESATRALGDIRALRSSMGGATKPSSTTPPKKTLKTGP